MNNIFLQILVIFLLLLANGIFAMAEIAIVSARKVRLQRLANEGNKHARTALQLADNPSLFFSTIQVGITLVGILAGAFGGVTLGRKLGVYLDTFPLLAPYGETIGIAIVVLLVTYFSLIIGELVPKRLAHSHAERIAVLVASPMNGLSKIASPVVGLLMASTEAVVRFLNVKPSAEPSITEEEIKVLIEQGTQIGVFEEVEQDMIEGVLNMDDRRVKAVMTPRPQIAWLDIQDSLDEIRRKVAHNHHSRFPVADDNLNNVLGVLYVKDLLAQSLAGESFDLKTLLHPALFVPETVSVLKVLELFKQEHSHLALVTDEYGSIEGLVTSDDILDSIVGDIPTVGARAEPLAVQREDGTWLLDGLLQIEQLKEIFDLRQLPDEEQNGYQTLAGFVINQVGHIPTAGQHFEWDQLRFEVVDMDGRRVDKVLVMPLQPDPKAVTAQQQE